MRCATAVQKPCIKLARGLFVFSKDQSMFLPRPTAVLTHMRTNRHPRYMHRGFRTIRKTKNELAGRWTTSGMRHGPAVCGDSQPVIEPFHRRPKRAVCTPHTAQLRRDPDPLRHAGRTRRTRRTRVSSPTRALPRVGTSWRSWSGRVLDGCCETLHRK